MKIISQAFNNNERIPDKYTCKGENINPPLEILDVPPATQSLAFIMDDIDSPNRIFVHWVVYNIDPKNLSIKEGEGFNNATEGINSLNQVGYLGPCPRAGVKLHHYYFKIYALDIKPNLPPKATKEKVLETIQNHILDKAELMGTYSL
jgi:Raf kinase inhibitor-like YbhB/YbcL family protein